MKRVNELDTRPIVEIDVGQSQVTYPLTDEERDRLLVGIAIKLGVINERTFRCPMKDTCAEKADVAASMKALYNKELDTKTGEWVVSKEISE